MTFLELAESLSRYETILEPDQNTPEWWAGAPSVCRAKDGTFYLAARMREGDSPRGSRGYEMRLLKSEDGRAFTRIHSLKREDASLPGFERPALVQEPVSGMFRLYGCTNPGTGWCVFKLDDVADPVDFDLTTRKTVLQTAPVEEGFAGLAGFKDPFVIHANGAWHMLVIGYDEIERAYHLVSNDGDRWGFAGENPILENAGWHNFYTRPACLLPLDVGFLLVYEGSNATWRDPVYNIATGGREYLIDIYHTLTKALSKDIEPVFGLERAGDIKHSNADISKAREMLGYEAEWNVQNNLKQVINVY